MSENIPLTLSLPDELVADLRARVAAGHYPDEAAAVADALRSAFATDAGFETWLRTDVVRALDEHRRDPEAALPLDQVVGALEHRRFARRGHA
jgi:antitoxin ParD1/3/4